MQVFNKKYCLIKKKYYICITKLITHLKTNKMKNGKIYLNLENEQLIINALTFDSYPENKCNGAYVTVCNFKTWMDESSIYNFIDN